MAPVPTNIPVSHVEKLERFNGTDKRWQQMMLFYLTTLSLAQFLKEDAPVMNEGETNREVITARDAWGHADFLCRNYVLNGLENTLYNVCCAKMTTKELWESLAKKYKTEDAGVKKFIGRVKVLFSRTILCVWRALGESMLVSKLNVQGINIAQRVVIVVGLVQVGDGLHPLTAFSFFQQPLMDGILNLNSQVEQLLKCVDSYLVRVLHWSSVESIGTDQAKASVTTELLLYSKLSKVTAPKLGRGAMVNGETKA
ncbi:hypothetical protein Acr_11g0011590 [Actinidia rufa]|uniref:Uncharacterized protein n=1 Tax=Actinidia rufa TaxID=165716 RepID=A0A7J0FE37_9ERIC|nr:hypothetical protein Acr_11g0011590 [Actinidia rufa]